MRRLVVLVIVLTFASAVLAFNSDKPVVAPAATIQPIKAAPIKTHRETRVTVTGVVKEISDTTLSVERSVKDNVETMEFILEKPAENIKVGDRIKVSYIKKDGKNVARKVSPVVVKRVINKTEPAKVIITAPPEASPSKK
jgi:hypothetical protein